VTIKGAIPYGIHGEGPKAPEGQAWDGAAAEAALKSWSGIDAEEPTAEAWAKFRKGFTWYNSAEPALQGSYKLAHHTISGGNFVTVWQGVAAAMAALMGARGGLNVPDADRRGIYNHLADHYADFEKEPPEFKGEAEYPGGKFKVLGVKVSDEGNRVLRFVGSDENEDRDGDIIVQDGWDLRTFRKHGVFLWGHDHDIPAIGKPLSARVRDSKLEVGVKFAGEEQGHDLADLVYRLYKDGFLSSTSVGFIPQEWEPRQPKAGQESQRRLGVKITSAELLELSAVNVPANANAVIIGAAKGAFDSATRDGLVKHGFLPQDRIVLLNDMATAYAKAVSDEIRAAVKDAFKSFEPERHGESKGSEGTGPAPVGPGQADVTVEDVRREIEGLISGR